MNKFSPVQLIIMVVAGFALVIAVLVFSFKRDSKSTISDVGVVMWGPIDEDTFYNAVAELGSIDVKLSNVTYVQKDPISLEEDFVRALAEGAGPDLIMLNQSEIIQNERRLLSVPFSTLPLRDYLDTYVPEAELFVTNEGILGVPFMLDPMVLFWNRTLFANAGIATPPRFWSEVMDLSSRLTISNSDHVIEESAIAMGEFRNLTHAKEIFLNLVLQAGNNVVVRVNDGTDKDGSYKVILAERLGFTIAPTVASLNFFTQFANPARDIYSWNRSLPSDKNQFLAGDLAMYLGFASEIDEIREKNPNLDFDISTVPQSQNSADRKVFGNMIVLSISRNSQNPLAAYTVASVMTSPEALDVFRRHVNLPPVRRDMLQADPSQPYESILFTSALWSRGVLEVDPIATTEILQFMVESFTTGQQGVDRAIERAQEEMTLILQS